MGRYKTTVRLVTRDGRRVLCVAARPGTVSEIHAAHDASRNPADVYTRMLGLIVAQAYHDGMSEISVSAQQDTDAVALRYRGLSEGGTETWWDMVPPPPDCYAGLVRAVIEAASFDAGVEPIGVIHAEINREPIELKVGLTSWYEVNLSWPAAGAASPSA